MIQVKFQEKIILENWNFQYREKIPDEDIDLILDKFINQNIKNIRKPVGTGLGLRICKKL